jgi:protein-tyrosine phosphatase
MRILMVCLGNICRSPLAEGILRDKLSKNGLDWVVDSAGTGGWHVGSLPDKRSVDIARKYGIDITYQRARKFRSNDFDEFDIIFAMDTSNYHDIYRMALNDSERQKVKMILEEVLPGQKKSVPDPYFDDNRFEEVFKMLDEACEVIIRKYRQNT